MTMNFEGVYPILATPFDDGENPDCESFDRLVRFMVALGVDGLTILGVPNYMQDILTGLIILAAVLVRNVGRLRD